MQNYCSAWSQPEAVRPSDWSIAAAVKTLPTSKYYTYLFRKNYLHSRQALHLEKHLTPRHFLFPQNCSSILSFRTPPPKSLLKQHFLPARSPHHALWPKTDSRHSWTESYQSPTRVFPGNPATVHVRAAKHAKICLLALPGAWCNLYSTAPAPSLAAPHPSSFFPILNSLHDGLLKTNSNTLSKGMPSQPCLVNNKPWWRRRTCLSGWLPGERNDLLQPSKQRRSEMGTKGQPSGSRAAQPHAALLKWWERSFGGETAGRHCLCSTELLAGIVLFLQPGIQIHIAGTSLLVLRN